MPAVAPLAERQLHSPTFDFWRCLRLSKPCLSCVCPWSECQAFFAQSNYGMRVMEPRRSLGKDGKRIFPSAALVVCCHEFFPGHHLRSFASGELLALLLPKILQSLDFKLETPRQVNTPSV